MGGMSKESGAAKSAAFSLKGRVVRWSLIATAMLLAGLACQAIQPEPEMAEVVIQITATPKLVVAATELPEPTATPAPVTGSLEDIRIQSWELGTDLDPDGLEIMDPKDKFQADETVYVILWTANNSATELPYEAYWLDPSGMEVLREVSSISTGETGWYLSGDPPPGGWEIGEYSIDLEVAGELIQSWAFQVTSEDAGERQQDEGDDAPEQEPEPDRGNDFFDPFDRDTGNWEGCEECVWSEGQLQVGPWPTSGAYIQHNIVCVECGLPRFYRMAVDIMYEEGPSERGFGLLIKWNEEIMITAEVTPWQTLAVWRYDRSNDEWTMLQGDFYGAVKPGRQVNRLEVELTPAENGGRAIMAVGVNGRKQIALEGQPSAEGFVGLTLFGHATGASFDNFSFEPLGPEAAEVDDVNTDVTG